MPMTERAGNQILSPSLHFVTQLWGDAYVQLFGETVLPGLLSDGNLGVVSSDSKSVYEIYTTADDFEKLSAMPSFVALTTLMKVDFHPIDDFMSPDRYQTMSSCHRQAIAAAEKEDRAIVFLQPDAFMADGAIRQIIKILDEGKRAVLVPGLYVRREPFLELIQPYSRAGGTILQIPPRELARITLRNLHPDSQSMIWGNSFFSDHCPHLYWQVGEEGLYARCAHVHPLAVYPRVKGQTFHPTIDWNYYSTSCPDPNDWYVTMDSDEICIVDLSPSPESHDVRSSKQASIETVVDWAEYTTTDAHRSLLNHPYRFHSGDLDDELWTAAENEANVIVSQVLGALQHSSIHLLRQNPKRFRIRMLGRLNRARGWLEGRRKKGAAFEWAYNAFEATQETLRRIYRRLKRM